VKGHFLVAASTLYRWLRAAEKGDLAERKCNMEKPRKTPVELARII